MACNELYEVQMNYKTKIFSDHNKDNVCWLVKEGRVVRAKSIVIKINNDHSDKNAILKIDGILAVGTVNVYDGAVDVPAGSMIKVDLDCTSREHDGIMALTGTIESSVPVKVLAVQIFGSAIPHEIPEDVEGSRVGFMFSKFILNEGRIFNESGSCPAYLETTLPADEYILSRYEDYRNAEWEAFPQYGKIVINLYQAGVNQYYAKCRRWFNDQWEETNVLVAQIAWHGVEEIVASEIVSSMITIEIEE